MFATYSGPFHYPRLKLTRAKSLIVELENELTVYAKAVAQNPPMYMSFNPTPDDQIPEMPEIVSAILGDVFHNMRASLDVMACELVRLSGEDDTGVYFPFARIASDYEVMIKRRKFHRAGADAVGLLWTLEPYADGNTALCAIHDYNVMDKHRQIIPHSLGGRLTWEIHHDNEGKPSRHTQQYTPEFTFAVSSLGDSPLGGQPLIPTLHELVKLCDGVIEAFAALVAERESAKTI